MVVFTLPHTPSDAEWERLYAAIRSGAHVVLRATNGDHRSLREALARRGFLDVIDGGTEGLELIGIGACA